MTPNLSSLNLKITAAGGNILGFGKALADGTDFKIRQANQVDLGFSYGLPAVYTSFWKAIPTSFLWNTISGFHTADEVDSSYKPLGYFAAIGTKFDQLSDTSAYATTFSTLY